MRAILLGLLALGVSGCAAQGVRPGAAARCGAASLESAPGKAWSRSQRWRYPSDDAAAAAYKALLDGTPAWPDWFVPAPGVLPAGTRLQMALSPGQSETSPGGFATFDNIERGGDVRRALAVRSAWKPKVDRVATYEVTQPLPVQIGPVGPQIDPDLCVLLPGRWSQAEMRVPAGERMRYLRVIAVRRIR